VLLFHKVGEASESLKIEIPMQEVQLCFCLRDIRKLVAQKLTEILNAEYTALIQNGAKTASANFKKLRGCIPESMIEFYVLQKGGSGKALPLDELATNCIADSFWTPTKLNMDIIVVIRGLTAKHEAALADHMSKWKRIDSDNNSDDVGAEDEVSDGGIVDQKSRDDATGKGTPRAEVRNAKFYAATEVEAEADHWCVEFINAFLFLEEGMYKMSQWYDDDAQRRVGPDFRNKGYVNYDKGFRRPSSGFMELLHLIPNEIFQHEAAFRYYDDVENVFVRGSFFEWICYYLQPNFECHSIVVLVWKYLVNSEWVRSGAVVGPLRTALQGMRVAIDTEVKQHVRQDEDEREDVEEDTVLDLEDCAMKVAHIASAVLDEPASKEQLRRVQQYPKRRFEDEPFLVVREATALDLWEVTSLWFHRARSNEGKRLFKELSDRLWSSEFLDLEKLHMPEKGVQGWTYFYRHLTEVGAEEFVERLRERKTELTRQMFLAPSENCGSRFLFEAMKSMYGGMRMESGKESYAIVELVLSADVPDDVREAMQKGMCRKISKGIPMDCLSMCLWNVAVQVGDWWSVEGGIKLLKAMVSSAPYEALTTRRKIGKEELGTSNDDIDPLERKSATAKKISGMEFAERFWVSNGMITGAAANFMRDELKDYKKKSMGSIEFAGRLFEFLKQVKENGSGKLPMLRGLEERIKALWWSLTEFDIKEIEKFIMAVADHDEEEGDHEEEGDVEVNGEDGIGENSDEEEDEEDSEPREADELTVYMGMDKPF